MSGSLRAALGLLLLTGCSSDAEGGSWPPRGPDGGMIEWDAASIGAPPSRDSGAPPVITGEGSERSECVDIARSCSARSAATCTSGLGCRMGGRCGGVPLSCSLQSSSYSCSAIEGCYWSGYSSKCSGTPRSCSSFTGDIACERQDGCHWDEECTGSATPCSLISVSVCLTQPGCTLE